PGNWRLNLGRVSWHINSRSTPSSRCGDLNLETPIYLASAYRVKSNDNVTEAEVFFKMIMLPKRKPGGTSS
ncbi:MAG TPA: hypothetical protein P5195_06670, partial [Anaerolineae bacterium]|nr:hypothetical protein [Anaerolineae bacterium]